MYFHLELNAGVTYLAWARSETSRLWTDLDNCENSKVNLTKRCPRSRARHRIFSTYVTLIQNWLKDKKRLASICKNYLELFKFIDER